MLEISMKGFGEIEEILAEITEDFINEDVDLLWQSNKEINNVYIDTLIFNKYYFICKNFISLTILATSFYNDIYINIFAHGQSGYDEDFLRKAEKIFLKKGFEKNKN